MSHILIADDNEQNLYLAKFLLSRRGHEIDEALNGQEAVDKAALTKYDLVLMDIQMPVMDGLTAARLIKEGPGATLIVALTAKAMRGDKESILAGGCDGYIDKPIDSTSFAEQVERYISEG